MNPNMVRWIVASCRTFFSNRKAPYVMFFENVGPKNLVDTNGRPIPQYIEFRMDGPNFTKLTVNEVKWAVEINVLIHANVDITNSEVIENMLGTMAAAYEDTIPVFKYGAGIGDDQSQIGCLRLIPAREGSVQVSRFGQVNPDTKMSQASVDGYYEMRQIL